MEIEFSEDDLPSPERRTALQSMIDAVREYARGLNAWECEFLDSVEAQVATHGVLTRAQREKLHELYTEHVDPDDDQL